MLAAALVIITMTAVARTDNGLGYDPSADPFQQYREAIAAAAAQNKLVLVIAGGEWCRWCHVLNRFIEADSDVEQRLDQAFVVMKVYVGEQNYNDAFFSQLPEARGAPHFWIISPERIVLGSQSTGAFERGTRGYDKEKFLAFIEHWAHPGLQASD
jgi:thioredoxin-related protein